MNFKLPTRFQGATLSVWNEFAELDRIHKPVNLGQGKPDFMPPPLITDILNEVVSAHDPKFEQEPSTYTKGAPRLRNALSKLYSKIYDKEINPQSEVIITCGAYEALYDAISGFVCEGDEVIVIEPFFDCYEPMTLVAGGKVRFIPLRKNGSGLSAADWKLDEAELRGIFNEKTKMIILNSPMNPLGKVFSFDELKLIAELCIKHNVICLSDEVYEWLSFPPAKHIKIATLPGMWERTITVGSGGKTTWVTGWKCGWAIAPKNFIDRMYMVLSKNTGFYVTPIQETVARFLEIEVEKFGTPESWITRSNKISHKKRDYFVNLLQNCGFDPVVPDGGFFIVADWSRMGKLIDLTEENDPVKDFRFAKWLVKNVKVSGIPPTAFYSNAHKYIGEDLIRFCFIKDEETMIAAADAFKEFNTIL